MEYRLKSCPYCKKQIIATAEKCNHCGKILNGQAKGNTQKESQPRKPLSESPLGYFLATAGGFLGGPIGLLVSPYVLLLLNRTYKPKNEKPPNRFLAWSLIGIIAAPICWLPIISSTPPKTTSQLRKDNRSHLVKKNQTVQVSHGIRPKTPVLTYKPASTVKYNIRREESRSWHGRPDKKRMVEVDLNDIATEQSLKEISRQIKNETLKPYDITIINYYLPKDYWSNQGIAWAIVIFPGPDGDKGDEMSIRFNGLRAEEMSALYNAATKYLARTDATESWLEIGSPPGFLRELVKNKDNTFSMRYVAPTSQAPNEKSSLGDKEVVLAKEPKGTRIEDREPNSFGEYYIINKSGDLEYWSKNGHFRTARNVRNISHR